MSSRKRNQVIEELIQLYQSEPCFWKIKSKDYHNRAKIDSAYKKLIEKLKESKSNTTKGTVVKKIKNLRCNVRKKSIKKVRSIIR